MAGTEAASVVLTGDSMITRPVTRTRDEGVRRLIEIIQGADITFTNLESLPNDFRGHPAQHSGGDHMAADATVLDDLIAMGFDLFATATNHTLDYSIAGLLAMMEVLESRGVAYAGIGRNLGEARMPVYCESAAGAVALISCASTFRAGQQAGEQRPDMQGRPGLNPLRHSATYVVKPEQMEVIQAIADDLGLERQRQERLRVGFGSFPPDDPDVFPLGDMNFKAGDIPAIERKMNERDLEAIATWVREAKSRAALVIVSIHAHESGETKEDPAPFIPEFARRMIDEGADVVAGHGPHILRGMEIYRGKPIFYSLGNFIDQHDLVYKMPADAYEKFRVDPSETPGVVSSSRNRDPEMSFETDKRYWQSIMPICRFQGDQLVELEILPLSLGYGLPVHQRGKPALATGPEAAEILSTFAALSTPFGTEMEVRGERGTVKLDG